MRAGDLVAFRPGAVHALDNLAGGRPLFALQLMLPNEEEFAEAIDRGGAAGLSDSELCTLIAERCGHAP